MVYGFVKQSNGHVSLYSEPGLGTTVRLYLPATGEPPAEAATKDEAQPVMGGGGTDTVLVVEDDPFVRGYAVTSLETLGYRVVSAVNGHEAMAL